MRSSGYRRCARRLFSVGLEITDEAEGRRADLWRVGDRHFEPARNVAFLQFEDALQEIFAVCVLPGKRFPDVINDDPEVTGNTYVLPDESLAMCQMTFEAPPESHEYHDSSVD